jgi:hypothetical protein
VPGTALVRIAGQLDREAAAVVRAGLDALCSPRTHPSPQDPSPQDSAIALGIGRRARDERTAGQLRADALAEIFRIALACHNLPDNGGERPQVVITVPLQTLQEEYGAATLHDGGALTAAAARRWACDAQIIPMVLGGAGQPLDVGRSQRLFTGPLRRALVVRDGGCAFPGWSVGQQSEIRPGNSPTGARNHPVSLFPRLRGVTAGKRD